MKRVILALLLILPFISMSQIKWTNTCEQVDDGDKNHILFKVTFTANLNPGYYIYSQNIGSDSLRTKVTKYKTSRINEREVYFTFDEDGISIKKGIWKAYNKVSFSTWLDLKSINSGVAGYRIDYRIIAPNKKEQIKQEIIDIYPQLKRL